MINDDDLNEVLVVVCSAGRPDRMASFTPQILWGQNFAELSSGKNLQLKWNTLILWHIPTFMSGIRQR